MWLQLLPECNRVTVEVANGELQAAVGLVCGWVLDGGAAAYELVVHGAGILDPEIGVPESFRHRAVGHDVR
ncbi:MAG: hypothetical protein AAFY69_10715, partial [Pseudomonadota bacterium]